MGCAGCSISGDGTPRGCGDKGHCTSGGCNKRNTFDWLSNLDLQDPTEFSIVEVSFKKGARKEFFKSNPYVDCITGDLVAVESGPGYDIGRVSLSGELVRLQMRKKKVREDRVLNKIIRIANHRDLDRLEEARSREKATLVEARVIARTLNLKMKIGDVEFQGDNRKATFYYTADGRIDFRELVKKYASQFRVKIEMRQIGSRQESGRIGGLGPCGRELCCSTWLSDFKSVSTSAARYQNLAINQTKLSGQCGRLKCCLNYELDSYIDAIQHFPKRADTLRTAYHKYHLVKTDIFKGLMYYIQILERGRGPIVALDKDRVKEVLAMNRKKEYPEEIGAKDLASVVTEVPEAEYEDLTGHIELPDLPKRKRGRGKGRGKSRRKPNSKQRQTSASGGGGQNKSTTQSDGDSKSSNKPKSKRRRPSRGKRRGPKPQGTPPNKGE
ncbi:MAG: regulatory iron-sulfur-containing complex subunit RicT [Bacteroidota bacterium]